MWWHQNWTMLSWFFMTLSMAVFWAAVTGAVAWAVRWFGTTGASGTGGSGTAPRRSTARHTLDERFARGEIGEDEYQRAREALSER